MKGKKDLRVRTKDWEEKYDAIKMNQYCKGCDKVLCSCKIKKEKKK